MLLWRLLCHMCARRWIDLVNNIWQYRIFFGSRRINGPSSGIIALSFVLHWKPLDLLIKVATNSYIMTLFSQFQCMLLLNEWSLWSSFACRFQVYCSPQSALIPCLLGHWYYQSMWLWGCKYLSILEALHGPHLMARTGKSLNREMHLCAVWHLGLFLLLVWLILLMTS